VAIAAALKFDKCRKTCVMCCACPNRAVLEPIDLTGLGDDEVDVGLPPPPTVPPRLEDTAVMKRTQGKTLDFVALQNGTATKKGEA
jgi:hypothetical protein